MHQAGSKTDPDLSVTSAIDIGFDTPTSTNLNVCPQATKNIRIAPQTTIRICAKSCTPSHVRDAHSIIRKSKSAAGKTANP